VLLNVVICDDKEESVSHLRKLIENYLFIQEIDDVQIELATTNQHDVLELFVKKAGLTGEDDELIKQPLKQRVLFLDINFGSDLPHFNGIELGRAIRRYDVSSDIVYVTHQTGELSDVIEYKIAPLGFISKMYSQDKFDHKIIEYLMAARERSHMSTPVKKMIEFKIGYERHHYPLEEVCYIRVLNEDDKRNDADYFDGDKLYKGTALLCLKNGAEKVLTKRLNIYEKDIPELLKLGRFHLINPLNHIKTIEGSKKVTLVMANDDEINIPRKAYDDYRKLLKKG